LCEQNGVQGYPTLKYMNQESNFLPKDYEGGRGFAELKKFAEENLASPACSVGDEEASCSDKEKGYIKKMGSADLGALQKEDARLQKMQGGSMKPEQKTWLVQRRNILAQLIASDEDSSSDDETPPSSASSAISAGLRCS